MTSQTSKGTRSLRFAVACTLLGGLLAGCSTGKTRAAATRSPAQPAVASSGSAVVTPATSAPGETPARAGSSPGKAAGTSPSASPAQPAAAPSIDPARVRANELGLVPVLMYHQIVANPGRDRYNQTPAQFKAELAALYADGYVPVTAASFVAGTFDLPAGKHPVVLTFDDSTVSQFGLTRSSGVKPGTAVALLLDFAASHAGFRPVATMYVNFSPPPFAGTNPALGLRWLVDHGFEIGNHTLSHANLRSVGAAKAQQEIVDDARAIGRAVPGYRVTTFALPFGVHPQPASIAWTGSAAGDSYHFDGVMEVGSNPARSPYSATFDGTKVPRIRSQSLSGADAPFESKHWLEWLRQHPDQRYTSDGDPAKISYPRGSKQAVAPRYRARARAY